MKAFGGLIILFVLVLIVVWVYFSYCLYIIAKKLNVQNPWLAWIPAIQQIYALYIARLPWLMIAGIVVAAIIGGSNDSLQVFNLVALAGWVYAWMKIADMRHRPKWWGVIMVIPIVNFFILYYLAFQDVSRNSEPAPQLP